MYIPEEEFPLRGVERKDLLSRLWDGSIRFIGSMGLENEGERFWYCVEGPWFRTAGGVYERVPRSGDAHDGAVPPDRPGTCCGVYMCIERGSVVTVGLFPVRKGSRLTSARGRSRVASGSRENDPVDLPGEAILSFGPAGCTRRPRSPTVVGGAGALKGWFLRDSWSLTSERVLSPVPAVPMAAPLISRFRLLSP